jgi:hypothetical protein
MKLDGGKARHEPRDSPVDEAVMMATGSLRLSRRIGRPMIPARRAGRPVTGETRAGGR